MLGRSWLDFMVLGSRNAKEADTWLTIWRYLDLHIVGVPDTHISIVTWRACSRRYVTNSAAYSGGRELSTDCDWRAELASTHERKKEYAPLTLIIDSCASSGRGPYDLA